MEKFFGNAAGHWVAAFLVKTPRQRFWMNYRFFSKKLSACEWLLLTFIYQRQFTYLLKVNNGNTRRMFEICSKLTIKTTKRRVFTVNFEQISHIFVVFPLSTYEKVNAGWVDYSPAFIIQSGFQMFYLYIKKNYSAKLCVSTLVPRLL